MAVPTKPADRDTSFLLYGRAMAAWAGIEKGKKIEGGGTEWFKTSRDEIVAIYQSIAKAPC